MSLLSPPRASHAHRMTYRPGRGETLVMTFEPYKSILLPHWRFRTPALAHTSSRYLYAQFLAYDAADDFVGMDMARKFIQMGMTRSKRYANYKGGRKYFNKSGATDGAKEENEKRIALDKSAEHKGREEKEEASRVFAEVLGWCRAHKGYAERKKAFLKQVKE